MKQGTFFKQAGHFEKEKQWIGLYEGLKFP
jgi:hypothetical protein